MSEAVAKAPSELSRRVLTGVLGGAILVAVLVFGGIFGTGALTLVMSLGMMHEFCGIALDLPDQAEKRYVLLLLAWLTVVASFLLPGIELSLFTFCFLILSLYFLATAKRYEGADFNAHFKELMHSVFGMFYTVFIPLLLPEMYRARDDFRWILLFLVIVFANDTGAYFGGKKWGRRKLYPQISPKKTVEGSLAGLASGVAITVVYKLALLPGLGIGSGIALALVVGIVAQLGDLCESYLKRAFDKKDSGSVLPGHGGFLDRFDGVVFSLPIMYAGIKILA